MFGAVFRYRGVGCPQKPASVATLGELLNRRPLQSEGFVAPLALSALEPRSQEHLHLPDAGHYEQWIAHIQPKATLDGELMGVELLAR